MIDDCSDDFPAHDELGTCRTSLVSPESAVTTYKREALNMQAAFDMHQLLTAKCEGAFFT